MPVAAALVAAAARRYARILRCWGSLDGEFRMVESVELLVVGFEDDIVLVCCIYTEVELLIQIVMRLYSFSFINESINSIGNA